MSTITITSAIILARKNDTTVGIQKYLLVARFQPRYFALHVVANTLHGTAR